MLERLLVTGAAFGGIRIRNADRVRLADVDVAGSAGSDGIKVEYSPEARLERCRSRGGYARGFRVVNAPGLVFAGNVATDNASAGIRIENSLDDLCRSNASLEQLNSLRTISDIDH